MSRVLITGSSSGIGQATALHLARAGHHIVAASRSHNSGEALLEAARSEGLTNLEVITIDVELEGSVRSGVGVAAAAGPIDVLINNAGISISDPIETAPMHLAKKIFEVNYFGTSRMIQAVLPIMRAQGAGTILNVSSYSARVPVAVLGHYGASKAAMEAMSEALAQEVSPHGIRVVLVEPGVTKTPMYARRKYLRPIDPNSPYMDQIRRLFGFFEWCLKKPLTSEQVAVAIETAMTQTEPKMRHLLGEDAIHMVRARERSSDEEWAGDRQVTDDEFWAWIRERGESEYFNDESR